jgi:hypothetical protein
MADLLLYNHSTNINLQPYSNYQNQEANAHLNSSSVCMNMNSPNRIAGVNETNYENVSTRKTKTLENFLNYIFGFFILVFK